MNGQVYLLIISCYATMLRFEWLQVVDSATSGKELLLTGSAEHLTTELAQAELTYTRSPGYDGADAIQVPLYHCGCFLPHLCVVISRPLDTNRRPRSKDVPHNEPLPMKKKLLLSLVKRLAY